MRLSIERKPVKVYPDPKRVISRFFYNGDERAKDVIKRIMELDETQVLAIITPLLQEYSKRHRNITKVLARNCRKLAGTMEAIGVNFDELTRYRKLLIGSYFTHEYSIESAAFFNPSIVEDPDQRELVEGEKRVIMSFRAVGEGHISSVVFRRALLHRDGSITVIEAGDYIDEAEVVKNAIYNKKLFLKKAAESNIQEFVINEIGEKLQEKFDYSTLRNVIIDSQNMADSDLKKFEYDKVMWLSDTYYDISFSRDTDISDRILFPISEFERKGIEDARFVKFTEEDGSIVYYATYTAFDGSIILPKLLKTTDFYDFKISPLYGEGARNKNLALFPRKVNGKYVMMSRLDGVNNYLMFSDKINVWEDPQLLTAPKFDWEFIQVGNCGSPIETADGWLVITHGVGPMRKYVLGACLLDLDDPGKVIGRLSEPLLIPNDDEREGYVPNVLYSCGSIIHNEELIIPYGLSDYCSSFASVHLQTLLDRLKSEKA